MPIGHSLTPCTTEIHNVRLTHPTNRSRNIVFVDTPAPCGELKPDSPISKWMDAWWDFINSNRKKVPDFSFEPQLLSQKGRRWNPLSAQNIGLQNDGVSPRPPQDIRGTVRSGLPAKDASSNDAMGHG
jgi:hypothetical protein